MVRRKVSAVSAPGGATGAGVACASPQGRQQAGPLAAFGSLSIGGMVTN